MSFELFSLPVLLPQAVAIFLGVAFLIFRSRSKRTVCSISDLRIHPIKSVRGVSVPRARLLETGLEGDRVYGLALLEEMEDGEPGYTSWTMFEVQDLGRFVTTLDEKNSSQFQVSVLKTNDPEAPPTLTLPFTPSPAVLAAKKPAHFRIGISSPFSVFDMGDEASEFFTRHLPPTGIPKGAQLRLVYRGPERKPLTGCGKGFEGNINFHNVMPLLLMNQSSWDDLVVRMEKAPKREQPEEVGTIDRFRGNIIFSGAESWSEDHWRKIRITPSAPNTRPVTIDVAGRNMRCVITTVNPLTGTKSPAGEPLKTMSSFRRIDEGAKYKVAFGMHAIPQMSKKDRAQGAGIMLSVGDKTEVLKTGKHFYINGYVGHAEGEKMPKRLLKSDS